MTEEALNIGVFDSGVGGLTIAGAIRHKLPGAHIHYCCDDAHFPYGPKAAAEVTTYVDHCIGSWLKLHEFRALVIACNTASTVALGTLRQKYDVPIVGVVPAIKPAASLSQSGVIALLATPGTVARPYTQELIAQFAAGCEVRMLGSARLVDIAEEKLRGFAVHQSEIDQIVAPLFSDRVKRIDHIILGCTHFPLLLEELKRACPWPVSFIDSSLAIANRVAVIAKDAPGTLANSGGSYASFQFTGDGRQASELEVTLKKMGFHEFRYKL